MQVTRNPNEIGGFGVYVEEVGGACDGICYDGWALFSSEKNPNRHYVYRYPKVNEISEEMAVKVLENVWGQGYAYNYELRPDDIMILLGKLHCVVNEKLKN